jgi:hypothetical protein
MNRFRDEFELEAEPYSEILLSKLEFNPNNID